MGSAESTGTGHRGDGYRVQVATVGLETCTRAQLSTQLLTYMPSGAVPSDYYIDGGGMMAVIYHGSWVDNAGNEGEYATDCVECVPACAREVLRDEGCEVLSLSGAGTGVYVGRRDVYTSTLRGPSEAVVRECMGGGRWHDGKAPHGDREDAM